jgi:secondary thiamine-phosphate synthase enzyme
MYYVLELITNKKNELLDITSEIAKLVVNEKIGTGLITIFVPHTTAAITINENTDDDVKEDFINGLNIAIPNHINFKHYEGNSDAHIKSSIIGVSQTIIIEKNKLVLGTWQGIYFCEFDGPRNRKVYVKIMK